MNFQNNILKGTNQRKTLPKEKPKNKININASNYSYADKINEDKAKNKKYAQGSKPVNDWLSKDDEDTYEEPISSQDDNSIKGDLLQEDSYAKETQPTKENPQTSKPEENSQYTSASNTDKQIKSIVTNEHRKVSEDQKNQSQEQPYENKDRNYEGDNYRHRNNDYRDSHYDGNKYYPKKNQNEGGYQKNTYYKKDYNSSSRGGYNNYNDYDDNRGGHYNDNRDNRGYNNDNYNNNNYQFKKNYYPKNSNTNTSNNNNNYYSNSGNNYNNKNYYEEERVVYVKKN